MKMNQRLKLFLQEKGIKQVTVAKKLGIKYTAFNAVLNDHAELKADMLVAVCKAIDVTPEYFFAYQLQENGSETAEGQTATA